MTIYAKLVFFILIFVIYSLTYIFERNNSTKAIQKILISIILFLMTSIIIFPSTLVTNYAKIMGVSRGPDAVLYLFIVTSLAINFICFKKISNLENKIAKVVQKLSIVENKS